MIFKNATVYRPDFRFHESQSVGVRDGKFVEPDEQDKDVCDCQGLYAIPGVIDIHTHGNSGIDFTVNTSEEGYPKMMRFLAKNGITSCMFTGTTAPEEELERAFRMGGNYCRQPLAGMAYPHGIYMEGPFLSSEKKGAQSSLSLREPDIEMFKRLNYAAQEKIKIVCVAPELGSAEDFIREISPQVVVSVAHTEADYEQAKAAFTAGATHVTHLFNAMPPLHHRKPGVIGAAWESSDAIVELTCDGVHLHPCVVRLVLEAFGAHRVCFISDSSFMCGLPDGVYKRDTRNVTLCNGKITLDDGTIAGSATCLFECMRRAISFGVDAETAIRCATLNPARAIGVENTTGSIAVGKNADFVICDKDYQIRAVYVKGVPVDMA